jgi:hypothetical protein
LRQYLVVMTAAATVSASIVLSTVSSASAAENAAAKPAVNGIPSPATAEITLDMSECGVMWLGTTGSCIISLQTWMDWAVGTKSTKIPVDGVYGSQTQALVETFQREYVPQVLPNGMFGAHSRAALARWFYNGSHQKYGSGLPCNPALGWGCDVGGVTPGFGFGIGGLIGSTILCGALGYIPVVGEATGVGCSVYFS